MLIREIRGPESVQSVGTKSVLICEICGYMHHLVIDIPDGMYCDHINHNGLDNRKANLRPATGTQNIWHRRKFKKPSRSKYKGVDWAKDMNRWRARIRVNGRRIYLGSFKNEIDAAKAYDSAAKKYHGEYASLNFSKKYLTPPAPPQFSSRGPLDRGAG